RLFYFALNDLIENRGHIDYEGDAFLEFQTLYENWVEALETVGILMPCEAIEKFQNILCNQTMTTAKKKIALEKIFVLPKDSELQTQCRGVLSLLSGGTTKLSVIFRDGQFREEEIDKIRLTDRSFGVRISDLQFHFLETTKAIFDWGRVGESYRKFQSISFEKVDSYTRHFEELQMLKTYIETHVKKEYGTFFRSHKIENNYCAYMNRSLSGSGSQIVETTCTQENFYRFLKENLPKTNTAEHDEIMQKIKKKEFLQKEFLQEDIPFEKNWIELSYMLERMEQYHSFLNETDENGRSTKEKIQDIFMMGLSPISEMTVREGGLTPWIAKEYPEPQRPWTYKKPSEKKRRQRPQITKRKNKCKYLLGEHVLPLNSLLYNYYLVFNELNSLTINKRPISVELKQDIIRDVFMTGRIISKTLLMQYLIQRKLMDRRGVLAGFDQEFKTNLWIYRAFQVILRISSEEFATKYDMIEDIILWCTLCNRSQNHLLILENYITMQYGAELSNQQIKEIMKLELSGWGQVSRKFLMEYTIPTKEKNAKSHTIIETLWHTNETTTSLVRSETSLITQLTEENHKLFDTNSYLPEDMLDEFPDTAPLKKSVWQAVQIALEVEKIMGKPPERIVFSGERHWQNQSVIARKEFLLHTYKNTDGLTDKNNFLEEISGYSDGQFKNDVLFLYYMQHGKCMYTGKKIDLEAALQEKKYVLDDIVPYDTTHEDHVYNKVLVQKKAISLQYPLDKTVQEKQSVFWKFLRTEGLLDFRKYEKLTETKITSHEENRFLPISEVLTAAHYILEDILKDTKITYLQAETVDLFVEECALKIVENPTNAFPKGKRAYLNCVTLDVVAERLDWNIETHLPTVKKIMRETKGLVTRYIPSISFVDTRYLPSIYFDAPEEYMSLVEHKIKNKTVKTIEHIIRRNCEVLQYLTEEKQLVEPKILIEQIDINALFEVDETRLYITGRTGNRLEARNGMPLFLSKPSTEYMQKVYQHVKSKSVMEQKKSGFTSEDNLKLYDAITEKFYDGEHESDGEMNIFSMGRGSFQALELQAQCEFLYQSILLFQCTTMNSDLRLIGGAKNAGRLRVHCNIEKTEKLYWVQQSHTGLLERKVDLSKVNS
ncbi:MAG: type II CRISPR RNA-guided endonuclease Cas9, partial [Bacillota bacterium]